MTVVTDLFRRLRLPSRLLGAAALLALAACGGGDRETDFQPKRVLVFGDEASVINTTLIPASGTTPEIPVGYRYTVNGFTTTTTTDTPPVTTITFDCNVNRIWVQLLAARAGFGLPGCPLTTDTAAPSRNYAQPGTGVAGLVAQIDDHLDGDTFTPTDLVTVYTGQKDVVDFYQDEVTTAASCAFDISNPSSAGPIAQRARQRGEQLAAQVNRIAAGGSGGRVLFVTVPNVGASPYGRLPNDKTGVERATCLKQLADAFNAGLRTNVLQDGRFVGLLQLDERVAAALNGFYGFANLTTAVCAQVLPACTTDTLIDPDSDPETDTAHTGYLWADDRHFGATMHGILGNLAVSRAFDTNPF
ncbi:MAG TPA: SGNH/GDSL hydrolase family protein [Methylibium sp.]|nr:SGNH/GDSL hydrolase family protein [Methylibium sp.]